METKWKQFIKIPMEINRHAAVLEVKVPLVKALTRALVTVPISSIHLDEIYYILIRMDCMTIPAPKYKCPPTRLQRVVNLEVVDWVRNEKSSASLHPIKMCRTFRSSL
jgi:hypothetical protein